MTQKDLVPAKQETALTEWAGFAGDDTGINDIEPSFPVLKITQATSKHEGAGKHGGDFWRSDTEQFMDEIKVVPIYRRTTRAYFKEASEKPDCSSPDAIFPSDWATLWMELNEPTPASCAECPYSKWGNWDGKTWVPTADQNDRMAEAPPCRESWIFLCEMDGELVQIRVNGKNIKPWRTLISRRLAPKRLPLYSHELTIKTERKVDGQNTWYEMVLSPRLLTVGDALVYQDLLRTYKGKFEEHLEQEEMPGTAADDHGTWVE